MFFVGICWWFVWKLSRIDAHPPMITNNFWPERDMSIGLQLLVAGIMLGVAGWLLVKAQRQWRKRQIGAIQ